MYTEPPPSRFPFAAVPQTTPNPDPNLRAERTVLDAAHARTLALEAGFSEAGIVAIPYTETERDASRFSAWIGAGGAATMRYLQRVAEDGRLIRARVETPFPWARSAIVCFSSYANPSEPLSIDVTHEQSDSLTGRGARTGRSSRDCTPDPSRIEPAPQPMLSSNEPWAENAWIARYAWSSRVDSAGRRVPSDYHKVLLKRLKWLESQLHAECGAFESRAYVDTGPVVERSLAVAAGLGWTGKNTCLIHPKLGSFGFLAVLLTSLELSKSAKGSGVRSNESASRQVGGSAGGRPGTSTRNVTEVHDVSGREFTRAENGPLLVKGALAPASSDLVQGVNALTVPDRCGSCTRCIEACPTHALDTPYQMDASRCIAYLTIEHKGPIAETLMLGIGRQVFGCDICQDVCPWNAKAIRTGPIQADPELAPRPELVNPDLDWLSSLDEQSFERLFNGSPVRRTGFNGLRRNIAIAMGNSGLAAFAPRLAEWAGAADEGLRHAARWALARLRNPSSTPSKTVS